MEFPTTVNSQEEFDALIKGRLERAKQQWEADGGIADARDKAKEATSRAEAAEERARQKVAMRDARALLSEMGVTERARQERILRLADVSKVSFDDEGEPNEKQLRSAIKAVHKDLPEVFGEDASVLDSAADASQGTGQGSGADGPITSEEQVAAMSTDEINSSWDRVSAFMRGER